MKPKVSISLVTRFCLLVSVLLAISLLMGDRFAVRHTHTVLDMRLREKATFINNFYAFLIADSLLRKDDVTLLQVVDQLEKDQEIISVVVVDTRGRIRYDADAEKMGAKIDDPMVQKALDTGEGLLSAISNAGGPALSLVSPLKVQGQAGSIGALRIEFTYNYIDKQIAKTHANFLMVLLGSVSLCVGLLLSYVRKWVSGPLESLRSGVKAINPVLLDANVPETADEFGEVGAAINELCLRVKAEQQNQQSETFSQGDRERLLIDQLSRALLPGSRLLFADKDNRVLTDTGDAGGSDTYAGRHLLDLITDTNFATLVGAAYQQEGAAARGPVTFRETPYEATVLRVPMDLSRSVRTIIALRETTHKETS